MWDIIEEKNKKKENSYFDGIITILPKQEMTTQDKLLSELEKKFKPQKKILKEIIDDATIISREIKKELKTLENANSYKNVLEARSNLRAAQNSNLSLKLQCVKAMNDIDKTVLSEERARLGNIGNGGIGLGQSSAGDSLLSLATESRQTRKGTSQAVPLPPGGIMHGSTIPMNSADYGRVNDIYRKPAESVQAKDFYNPNNIVKMDNSTKQIGDDNFSNASKSVMETATNALAARGMTNAENADSRVKIIPVVKVDPATGFRWYEEQTSDGRPLQSRVKHIDYYQKCDIDAKSGVLTDREGVMYRVIYDTAENMPEIYKKQYKEDKGIDVDAILNEKDNITESNDNSLDNLSNVLDEMIEYDGKFGEEEEE